MDEDYSEIAKEFLQHNQHTFSTSTMYNLIHDCREFSARKIFSLCGFPEDATCSLCNNTLQFDHVVEICRKDTDDSTIVCTKCFDKY